MLCILYLKSMHKIVYNKKTNKYRLIDSTSLTRIFLNTYYYAENQVPEIDNKIFTKNNNSKKGICFANSQLLFLI